MTTRTTTYRAEDIDLSSSTGCYLRIHPDDGDPRNPGMGFWQHHDEGCQWVNRHSSRLVAGYDESGPVDTQQDYEDLVKDFELSHQQG